MKKLNIFSLTVVLAVALFAVSCNNNSNKVETAEETKVAAVFGVDSILSVAPEYVNDTIEVEGVCVHICSHGAGKISLMGSDDTKTIMCHASKELGAFKQECVNSVVRVKGVIVEQRMDEAYLQAWEEQIKAQTVKQHGEGQAAGCDSEMKAHQEQKVATPEERIANLRARIAERNEKEGLNYLSFYSIVAIDYEIVTE